MSPFEASALSASGAACGAQATKPWPLLPGQQGKRSFPEVKFLKQGLHDHGPRQHPVGSAALLPLCPAAPAQAVPRLRARLWGQLCAGVLGEAGNARWATPPTPHHCQSLLRAAPSHAPAPTAPLPTPWAPRTTRAPRVQPRMLPRRQGV